MRKTLPLGLSMLLALSTAQAAVSDVLRGWFVSDRAGLLEGIIFFAIFMALSWYSFSKMGGEGEDKKHNQGALIALSAAISLAFTIGMILANVTLRKAAPFGGILLIIAIFVGVFKGITSALKGSKESAGAGAVILALLIALIVSLFLGYFALQFFCENCDLGIGDSSTSTATQSASSGVPSGIGTSASSSNTSNSDAQLQQELNIIRTAEDANLKTLLAQYGREYEQLKQKEASQEKLDALEKLQTKVQALKVAVQTRGVTQ